MKAAGFARVAKQKKTKKPLIHPQCIDANAAASLKARA
jgi:hypothetical protein